MVYKTNLPEIGTCQKVRFFPDRVPTGHITCANVLGIAYQLPAKPHKTPHSAKIAHCDDVTMGTTSCETKKGSREAALRSSDEDYFLNRLSRNS